MILEEKIMDMMKRNLKSKKKNESSKIRITETRRLLAETGKFLEKPGATNNYYGLFYSLKRYASLDVSIPLNCTCEHGLFLSEFVCHAEVMHHVPCILTFSPYREKVISELTDIQPVAIGPYIAYAPYYYSADYMKTVKQKYGRILLVMPSHSVTERRVEYDVHSFIQQIEDVKKNFDTVMVCMYWNDLILGKEKLYKKQGYIIVSAGKTESTFFLSRLKYILGISDAVFANAFTTGLVYALYMGKPVKLFCQQLHMVESGGNNSAGMEVENQMDHICSIFEKDDFSYGIEEKEWINYLFGFEKVKTKEEMRNLLRPLQK